MSELIRKNKAQRKLAKKAETRERERKALELRKAGMTYQQIADSIGVASSSVSHAIVKRALDRLTNEPADDLRKIMDERLNTMLMVTWPQVQAGDNTAINQALRIMDRQAALRGLDAPQRIEHSGGQEHTLTIGGDRDDYIKALQEYRASALGPSNNDAQGVVGAPSPTQPHKEGSGSDGVIGSDVVEAEVVE